MIPGAILLLVAALALVVAELFLPTHGLLAILAAGAAIGAVFLAYRAAPVVAMIFAVFILLAAPVVFYGAVRIYPRTAVGKKVLLDQPRAVTSGFEGESARLGELVGRRGVALSLLRPAGSVEVEGRMIDAISDAEVIEAGSPVEVVSVVGLKVLVKSV